MKFSIFLYMTLPIQVDGTVHQLLLCFCLLPWRQLLLVGVGMN